MTGIASDIAKMRILLSRNVNGIWTEITENQPWLPVLRKPNHYQTRIQFVEHWIVSKLLYGNTYVLKQRDDKRGIVTAMYVLHPGCVKPLVTDSGDVYYEVSRDDLSRTQDVDPVFLGDERIVIPASEIIHDRMTPLWHPLVGVSPLYAAALSATMGNRIQQNSTTFFNNLSRPGGMLSAPGHIADDTAARLSAYWNTHFGGQNVGKIAVAGDGLKFESFTMRATDAQLFEQLGWTVQDIGRVFHYPAYKLGGPLPPYSAGPQILAQMYYNDCLHPHIENLELCLDEGLELPLNIGTELDIDNLLRMDTAALYEANSKGVQGGFLAPNEARFKANYGPVDGGDAPYLQQQNYSLAALAKRDTREDPFDDPDAAPEAFATTEPNPTKAESERLTSDDIDFFKREVRELVGT